MLAARVVGNFEKVMPDRRVLVGQIQFARSIILDDEHVPVTLTGDDVCMLHVGTDANERRVAGVWGDIFTSKLTPACPDCHIVLEERADGRWQIRGRHPTVALGWQLGVKRIDPLKAVTRFDLRLRSAEGGDATVHCLDPSLHGGPRRMSQGAEEAEESHMAESRQSIVVNRGAISRLEARCKHIS